MSLPRSILARLLQGQQVAAEVPTPLAGHRAFVVIIPRVPSPAAQPTLWSRSGTGEAWLRDSTAISGFEIRYRQHDAKYTDAAWGWDYDHVLADPTTRVRWHVVDHIDASMPALARWLPDITQLGHPDICDSSLVTSPIDVHLSRTELYPQLTQPYWKR